MNGQYWANFSDLDYSKICIQVNNLFHFIVKTHAEMDRGGVIGQTPLSWVNQKEWNVRGEEEFRQSSRTWQSVKVKVKLKGLKYSEESEVEGRDLADERKEWGQIEQWW
jgi:hypothetical protein